jgi:mannose-6-phosphate isomerase-like protein (cupin superfamily)/pyrroloquinoline quinone (PQQ) biosynthesis protein C
MSDPKRDIAHLQRVVDEHPIWDCALFKACGRGELSRDDFRSLFGQYTHYSNNFTRYLAGVLLSCEDDLLRARLSENLWEEGGGAEPDERHAELFRRFLVDTMGVTNPHAVPREDFTEVFVSRYLRGATNPDHTYGCAFLALGTEGIVARTYRIFVDGMLKVGIPEDELGFFKLHILCDDEHAATLMDMMLASHARPDWRTVCERAIDDALTARREFFEALYEHRRQALPAAVASRVRSMLPEHLPPSARHHYARTEHGDAVSPGTDAHLGTAGAIQRLDFDARQTLDVLTIALPPGASTGRHRHAHETVLHVMEGTGSALIGDQTVSLAPGDTAFIPRWVFHQTRNTGTQPLVALTVTDSPLCSSILGTN